MYNFACLDNSQMFYFTDVISVPQKYIEHLENLDKNEFSYPYVEKWKTWNASNDNLKIYGQKKHINLPKNLLLDNNLNKKTLYVINAIKEAHYLCSDTYTKVLNIKKPTTINHYAINKYFPGESMGLHVDSYENSNEKRFTILIYLNDDYEGGEIEFPNQNIKFKPKAGSALIFPTQEPYAHKSYDVLDGFKYFVLGEFGLEE
jgi:Rps23 Pro-64 3,4-dihydroxylase Tpa1-like proline 4-hydroxylase